MDKTTAVKNLPLLRIQLGNAKLSKLVGHVSTPAGYTCPGADKCLTFTTPLKRKIKTRGEIRCYAANIEAYSKQYHAIVWHNFELLRPILSDTEAMLDLYSTSLDMHPNLLIFRSGVSGDFKTRQQALAFKMLAESRPRMLFYAYTKSVNFFADWLDDKGQVLPNLFITCSLGGKYDDLVRKRGFRCERIVKNQAEADALGLPVDHDDTYAMQPGGDFAHLIHGQQPAGSPLGKYARANGYREKDKDPLLDIKTYEVYTNFIKRTTPAQPKRNAASLCVVT